MRVVCDVMHTRNAVEKKKLRSYFLIARFGLQASPKPSIMKQKTPAFVAFGSKCWLASGSEKQRDGDILCKSYPVIMCENSIPYAGIYL